MADLSRQAPRAGRQDRLLSHRDSIVPNRRDTQAPQRQFHADMRSARMGDGGAEELMRILGGANRAADAFTDYANEKHRVDEEANASAGAADHAAGTIDQEQMQRSRAYRQSVSRGRAQQSWFEFQQRADTGLRELINSQTEADPAERNRQIDAFIEQSFREFALDPETSRPRDFGDPSAMRWVAEQMAPTRAQLRSAAYGQAEERINEQAITTAADGLRASLRAGHAVNIEDSFRNLPPAADRRVAKRAFITVVREVTTELAESDDPDDQTRSLQLVDQMIGSLREQNPGDVSAPGAVQTVDIPASGSMSDDPADEQPARRAPTGRLPIQGAVTSAFGTRGGDHNGVDIDGRMGDPVHAPAGGRIKAAGRNARSGNFIIIDHGGGVESSYSHLSRQDFRQNQRVEAGDVIGAVGNSGRVRSRTGDGSHLHYVVRVGGREVDPISYRFADSAGPAGEEPDGTNAVGVVQDTDPVEMAAASSGERLIPEMRGAYTLNPQERADLREYRAQLADRIETSRDRAQRERWNENSGTLLDRLNGVGTYPTESEIRDLRRTGDIGPEQAAQALGLIRGDRDRAQAQADRQEYRVERESRRRAESRIEAIMAPVYAGQRSPEAANSMLLSIAATIRDPEERRTVIGAVRSELGGVVQTRQQTPAYLDAVENLETLQRRMIRDLPTRLRGAARERAIQNIQGGFSRSMTRIGREATGAGNIEGVSEQETRRLISNYDQAYGRR